MGAVTAELERAARTAGAELVTTAEVVRVADVGRNRLVEAQAGGSRVNALLPEGSPVAPGPAHLVFERAQTRVYLDGWLAEGT